MSCNLSFVVATKDRPEDLLRLLQSLAEQTKKPDQIVVVDASASPVQAVLAKFNDLPLSYIRHWPPSAAAQRNIGVNACSPEATIVGFVDDDVIFEITAVEDMIGFWETAASNTLGAAFNIRNYAKPGPQSLKRSALAERLGLYKKKPGFVALSGWHTIITEFDSNQIVEWLPTTAVTWRRDLFQEHMIDEFFDGYSYLEDLDFSYSASRFGNLFIVSKAGYRHFPSVNGRCSARSFGRIEIRNRLYFVRKHRLSLMRCCFAISIRMGLTLGSALRHLNRTMFLRLVGNLESLFNPDLWIRSSKTATEC